ncbi:Asp-tRNA(Asn)/Glu-tRNA(Gln) amidotransferase subunit GatB [Candidatus Parcubacteria bacterium]|nr:MAG: Asp-tRNA(Asn)/Glu-tRNA(Gln) amidotransferase subunit GatB [Candidatus Parcubacteria bacterium]
MSYEPTIGLEVHVELKTRTKMFCDSPNNPDPLRRNASEASEREPNKNVCPVCLGHPGTLPVPNKDAIIAVIRVGLALGGTINPVTKFDRKNYFYPDLPKGYQISQYDKPIVVGGNLRGVRLRRIHLEEDTGRLLHETPNLKARGGKHDASFVDFNRAGVPLMELVTEPDIRSADEAVLFAKELQLILQYLGVSDADMEKGHLRLEANASLNMGTKVELKNINSFKALGAAIAYELKRQEELLERGEKIVQETRGWNDAEGKTVSQRSKEEAHDYRYFPEPDIPPFETSVLGLEDLKHSLPELPEAKRERFMREFGLSPSQTEVLIVNPSIANYFEAAVSELATRDDSATSAVEYKTQELLFNYLTTDLQGLVKEKRLTVFETKVTPEHLAHLVDLIADGKIMSRQAKEILRKIFETGADPEEILEEEGLHTISESGELENVVREVIEENPAAVADYRKGKAASLQFLIGKAMGKLKGRGNPAALQKLFAESLK